MKDLHSWAMLILLLAVTTVQGQERIKILLTGQIDERVNPLHVWFNSEPLIEYHSVPSRDLTGLLGGDKAMTRFIRQYFPRTYERLRYFDFILLNSPVIRLFTGNQLAWMYDAIVEGAGGLNTASIMSQWSDVYGGWVSSQLQEAFPNDAPTVVAEYGGATSPIDTFHIVVNRDFPEPVLTPFIPLGIETFRGDDSRMVIPREGSLTMAWTVGNFPKPAPYLVTWEFEKGRTMTLGNIFGHTWWSSYRGVTSDNIYALDVLVNMLLYGVKREPITDVEIMHRVRLSFLEFRSKMAVLLSLMDFVEKFGANSQRIQEAMWDLEEKTMMAEGNYLGGEISGCESIMNSAFQGFKDADQMARRLKDSALIWVYVIEWTVTTAVMIICSFALWTLMIRRRLYRVVKTTRLV